MEVRFDGHCFGCGPMNEDGLQMSFVHGPQGSVCELILPDRFQSWSGMAHGGVVALMLDEAVGWAAWHEGHPGVTGRLQVNLRRPLKLGERVRVVGKVERVRRSLVYANAYVESLVDGGRIADGSATLVAATPRVDPDAKRAAEARMGTAHGLGPDG